MTTRNPDLVRQRGTDARAKNLSSLLSRLLVFSLAISILFALLSPVLFERGRLMLILLIAWGGIAAGLLVFARQGHFHFVARSFVIGMWLLLNALALLSGGVHGIGLPSLITMNLFAGILLGARFALGYAFLSILAGFLIFIAQFQGVFPVDHANTAPLPTWIELTANIVVVFIIMRRTINEIEGTLEETGRYAKSLADSNQELLAQTRELEVQRSALRESEERYRLFFAASHDAIIMVDGESQRIVEVNEAAKKLYGYPEQELIGLSALDLTANPDATRANMQQVSSLAPGDVFQGTNLHRRKDGSTFSVDMTVGLLSVAGKRMIYSVLRDSTERMRAEEILRRSEARFRGLVEQSPYSIVIHDAGGRPVLSNRAFQELWHVSPEEMSSEFLRFSLQDSPEAEEIGLAPYFARALTGEYVQIPAREYDTFRGQTGPGAPCMRWIQAYLYPVQDVEGTVQEVVLVHEDVTERKLAEEALAESENRYRAIVETTTDLICRFKPDTTLTFVNDAYCAYFGRNRSELLDRPFLNLIPAEQHDAVLKHIDAVLQDGNPVTYEHQVMTPAGELRWQQWTDQILRNEHGEIVELQSVGRDVTQRRQAEEALRLSEERYRSIVEDQTELIVRWLPDGTRTFVNESYCRFFGKQKNDLIGTSSYSIHSELDQENLRKKIASLTPEEPAKIGFLEATRFDGEKRWLQWLDRALFDENGTVREFLSVGQDITERKVAQDQLEASLAEKNVLLREIHHRVKNNLQVVSSLLKLQSVNVQDPTVQDAFAESHGRIMTMALVHERLYGSESLAQVDFRSYLPDLINQIFRSMGAASRKIKYQLDVGPVALKIDIAIPCGLLVNEIVTNALKHAFPDGQGGTVKVCMERIDTRYLLQVQDDGIGMIDAPAPGSDSLGMQLIHTLTAQLEGTLEINGQGGTTVTIQFPA